MEVINYLHNSIPLESINEKNTHEVIKVQTSRLLRSDNFVILDTMNFIKGYRYEMYCIARGSHSTRCVVGFLCLSSGKGMGRYSNASDRVV